ncbi:hypothetical protein EW146_g9152 [Bondarzewia mesenterica]|uniref:Uncharacterized protein n=1 Tax=Bondarzewia mesenterica TaxID=1095465 RepID=A0A4S4LE50_9AGAM|nr:hypothetical protein EW146_g9152 [Bondarzewia mesenterica]
MMTDIPTGNHQLFIAHDQEALWEFKAKLLASELKKYDKLADKWNAATPPLDVQRVLAKKYGHKYIKEFARQMYKQLSMRVFMLHASQNKDKKKQYTHSNILEDWGNYSKKSFAVSPNDVNADTDADGAKASKKNVMTAAYREVTSNEKSTVPWIDIKEHQSEYINAEYLPEGYQMKEPSKMVRTKVVKLMDHWHMRQAKEEHLVVFESYKDKDGGAVVPSEGPWGKKRKVVAASAKGKAKEKALVRAAVKKMDKGKGKQSLKGKEKAISPQSNSNLKDDVNADSQSDDAKADADTDDEDIIWQLQALEGSEDIEDEASSAQMEE